MVATSCKEGIHGPCHRCINWWSHRRAHLSQLTWSLWSVNRLYQQVSSRWGPRGHEVQGLQWAGTRTLAMVLLQAYQQGTKSQDSWDQANDGKVGKQGHVLGSCSWFHQNFNLPAKPDHLHVKHWGIGWPEIPRRTRQRGRLWYALEFRSKLPWVWKNGLQMVSAVGRARRSTDWIREEIARS